MSKIFNDKIILPLCKICTDTFQRDLNGQIIQINGIDQRCDCYYANKFLESNIGYDYWNVEPDSFQGDPDDLEKVLSYINRINNMKKQGQGMYIYGPDYGTGKTTLATMILKHVLMNTNYACLFVPFSELVILNTKLINGSFDKNIDEKIDIIKNVDFLVLDDLAKEYDSQRDNGRATMNALLRYRDLWNKPTIYTANVPIEEVANLYGGSNYSIIYGRSVLVEMNNTEDFRKVRKIQQLIKERIN